MKIPNLTRHIVIVALIEIAIHAVHAEYSCLCNYNVELPVTSSNKSDASVLGYMYEFDCKPVIQQVNLDSKWYAISFEKQLGFVHGDGQTVIQTCAGSVPVEDKITTTIHQDMSSTTTVTSAPTSKTSTVHTTSYTTLADTISTQTISPTSFKSVSTVAITSTKLTTSPSTTETTTHAVTSLKSTTSSVTSSMPTLSFPTQHSSTSSLLGPQVTTGHALLSSALLVGDPNRCGSGSDVTKMTQYGNHCYQIVGLNDYQHRPWFSAELYCKLHGGHLLSILHEGEEEYAYNLLKYRNLTTPVWIGLNDKHGENFKWSSGEPFNWQPDWVPGDSLPASCVILDPVTYPGQWRNINCHTRHAFICEYNTIINNINNNGMNLIG